MRRFSRPTNAVTKKIEMLAHAVALPSNLYDFARRHQILRISLAMAAGVSNRLWTVGDLGTLREADPKAV